MKIGIVGYQGSGKSTLFEWLTGVAPDPAKSHETQSAMAPIPEPRIDQLCEIYSPKKVTQAALELVDTPGLSRTHEGSAAKLGLIREAGCLVIVVGAYAGVDPLADLESFEEDLLLADLDIVSGRVARLQESIKKPRPNREQEQAELEALEPLVAVLEDSKPLHQVEMTEEQARATRSFRLLTEKPRLNVINLADDEEQPARFNDLADRGRTVGVPIGLQLELARLSEEDRMEMIAEMGFELADRDALIRDIMDASGQMIFFTAGEKEVRTWIIRKGGTALEAAGNIHTDLARGFIRAEVMKCSDLIQYGSERELKAAGLVRQEPKDYVIQDGDILNIRFNV